MTFAIPSDDAPRPQPILPGWVLNGSVVETIEDAAFASGAALSLLHVVLSDPHINVPAALLGNRLALRASVHCLRLEGRAQSEADVRDAYVLTAAGDVMGPGGDMLTMWRAGSALALNRAGWAERLCGHFPEDMQDLSMDALKWAMGLHRNPVAKAAAILTRVLQARPRQEAVALICADVVLARALGWQRPMPLLGQHVTRKALRRAAEGKDITLACHQASTDAARDGVRLAHELARRAARLCAVAPKLRSKASDQAVALFLSEDAVLPSSMLSPVIQGSKTPMTARSARRLCERLIELGVVRELTGRSTFRLYGVA